MPLDGSTDAALRAFSWSLGSGSSPWRPPRVRGSAPALPRSRCPLAASCWVASSRGRGEGMNVLRKTQPRCLTKMRKGNRNEVLPRGRWKNDLIEPNRSWGGANPTGLSPETLQTPCAAWGPTQAGRWG